MKGLRVTKIANEIRNEVWKDLGRVRSKTLFPEISQNSQIHKTFDSNWNSKVWESFNFFFSAVFC